VVSPSGATQPRPDPDAAVLAPRVMLSLRVCAEQFEPGRGVHVDWRHSLYVTGDDARQPSDVAA